MMNIPAKNQINRDIFKTMKWLFVVGNILGACPILFQKNYRRSAVLINIHSVWSICVVAAISTTMYFKFFDFKPLMNQISSFLVAFEYIANTVNCLIIIVGARYQRHMYLSYMLTIQAIDKRLLDGKSFCTLHTFLWYTSIKFSVLGIFILTVILFFNRFDYTLSMELCVIYMLPNIIIMIPLIQYYCLLYAIAERYRQISNGLRQLFKSFDFAGNDILNEIIIRKDNVIAEEDCFNGTEMNLKLMVMRKAHLQLNYLEAKTARSFGWLVLCLIGSAFVIAVATLYSVYETAKTKDNWNWWGLFFAILWLMLHNGKLWIILSMNSKVIEEVLYHILHSKK